MEGGGLYNTAVLFLSQGSVWINNRSRIVQSDYVTYNGVIHHISALLTPYALEDKPVVQPDKVGRGVDPCQSTAADELTLTNTHGGCRPICV